MMKHIAVILRGHIRTWNYTRPAVFDFYDSIAEKVDYYFATWNHENFHMKTIEDDFIGKNLIKLLCVSPDSRYYNSWDGPPWLSYNLLPYKHLREKEVTYDAVFDTRPDIIYSVVDHRRITKPEENILYSTGFTCQPEPNTDKLYIGLQDHFFMSTSKVHDRMSERFIHWNDIGCHSMFVKLAQNEGYTTSKINWIIDDITRPNAFEKIPSSKDYFDYQKTGIGYKILEQEWAQLNTDDKIAILKRHGIREEDYRTQSIMAKL